MDDLFGLNDNPIDRFTNRFGMVHGHLEMAYHAALPLALTPDLLYLIWANFRSDAHGQPLNMQWVTVADLILSPLCREIRHETYVMETAVRQELLNRMAQDERFGPEYILRLGQFIQHYASQYIQSDIPSLRQFAQAQVWAAQAYTEPDRLLENLAGQYSQQPDEAETVRLADLLDTFSEPLNLDWVPTTVETTVNYDRLHTFGDGLAKFVRGDTQSATRQLRRLLGPTRELNIGSIPLPVPTAVSQALAKQEDKVYTYRVTVYETAVSVEHIDTDGTSLGTFAGRLNLPQSTNTDLDAGNVTFDLSRWQHLIQTTFNQETFNDIIYSLSIDNQLNFDPVAITQTIPSFAGQIRELLRYLKRRNQLDKLLALCLENEPDVDWAEITLNELSERPPSFYLLLEQARQNQLSQEEIKTFGRQLFNILFDDETLQVDFFTFYEQAINENAFLRIEIEIEIDLMRDIALFPWELICLPENTSLGSDWLAAAPETILVRLPRESDADVFLLPKDEPVRIALIVGPEIYSDSPLIYEPIWEAYQLLAQRYPKQFELLPILNKPKSDTLDDLLANKPHFIHLLVHSRLTSQGEGQIAIVENPDGLANWFNGDSLVRAEALSHYQSAVIILQSNDITQPEMFRGLQDVAAVLGKSENIPAVLSWQFPMESSAVVKFIHAVFPSFVQGLVWDEAVQNGRRALLRDENPLAFAAPSLFSNTIVRRRTANEPVPRTLPISLGVALAGSDVTIVLEKGEVLPAKSEPLTLVATGQTYHLGLGFIAVQLFQGEMVLGRDNLLLADVVIDDPDVYSGEIEIEATVSVNADSSIQFQVNHAESGFSREITVSLRDDALIGQPRIQDVAEIINWQLQGVTENYHLATLTAVSDWLNTTDADRVMVITGERSSGKTTVAALLARYFRGDSQPPNNLHALAPISTSTVYFCQPSRPETLHPRSFILTIATQWASRDSHFAYLQSIIENHESYELDELVTQLLIKPFTDIDELIYPGSIVFLIDDLDAALQYSGENNIVDVILQIIDAHLGVRFLLTSQMQTAVREKLAYVAAQYLPLGDRYENFDIHFGLPLPGTDMRYPLIVTSETNGELRDVEQSFSSVAKLGYERLARLRDLASNSEEVLAIGQRLFGVLMREPNYEMLRRSLNAARNRGKEGLRVRVRFDDPALQSYPWELCHDGKSFIFNNPDQPVIFQRIVATENYQAPRALPRPTRLLVAISAPVDLGQADMELHEKVIREATAEVVTSSELDLQILRQVTLNELLKAAQSYQPDIVHFVTPSSAEKEGALILETESGRSNVVPVREIMRILGPLNLHCVLLSPINIGTTGVTQLAPQFIQQGIPTIFAEQFFLRDQLAVTLWNAFYRALLFDRLSFEGAIQNARSRLAVNHHNFFWNIAIYFAKQEIQASELKAAKKQTVSREKEKQLENIKTEDTSAWLRDMGFSENPFDYLRAERFTENMLQATYVSDAELEQQMFNPRQSMVFLAAYGGGKTAARQYIKYTWEDSYPNTLVATYNDFTLVAESLPNCQLQDHITPLLQAILTSIRQSLEQEPEKYMQLYELDQIWWLKMFATYSSGGLNDLLNAHLTLEAYIRNSVVHQKLQLETQQQPFNNNVSFSTILRNVVDQCQRLGFERVLILVDEIDDYYQNDEVNDLANMLNPLFRTVSPYETALWKFFLPNDLQYFVSQTAAVRKKAIVMQTIHWDQGRLLQMLRYRLLWASNGQIESLDQLADYEQSVVHGNIDETLVEITLDAETFHKEMGIPRTLLYLSALLIQTAAKRQELLITKAVWEDFRANINYSYEKPKQLTIEDLVSLFDRLVDEEAFQILAFEIDVSVDNIAGEHVNEKLSNLIKYAIRRNKLEVFMEKASESFPLLEKPLQKFSELTIPLHASINSKNDPETWIYDHLVSFFDEEEFNTLCFDLNIDYREIEGAGLNERIINLINQLKDDDQLYQLILAIQHERPFAKAQNLAESKDGILNYAPPFRMQLRQFINQSFNESELRDLCFDLNVEYDDLPGIVKVDKARELVNYFEEKNQLYLLVEAFRKARPNYSFTIQELSSTRSKLRDILVAHFDMAKLNAISLSLGLPLNDKLHEVKADKARELITYLERHNRLPELIEIIKKEIPGADL